MTATEVEEELGSRKTDGLNREAPGAGEERPGREREREDAGDDEAS